MRALLIAAAILSLASCQAVPEWSEADTPVTIAAKEECGARARERNPEPACGPASYRFLTGKPVLTFRNDSHGIPRCSYHEMERYSNMWGPSYRLCMQEKGVAP
jgi:hypothetical protein